MGGDVAAVGAEEDAVHLGGEALQQVAGGVLGDPCQGLVLLVPEDELLPICVLHGVPCHCELWASWFFRLVADTVDLGVVELQELEGEGPVGLVHGLGASRPLTLQWSHG